jgi:hypothetical protein
MNDVNEQILSEMKTQTELLRQIAQTFGLTGMTPSDMPAIELKVVQQGRILSEEEDRQRGEAAVKAREAAAARARAA